MPRMSPYLVRLTQAEHEALAARVRRYTSPYRDVIRAKIVLLAARGSPMTSLPLASTCRAKSLVSGENVSSRNASPGSKSNLEAGGQPAFPPSVVVEVKALACERPARRRLPLARWSLADLRREVIAQGLVAEISGTTLWRWLSRMRFVPGAIAAGSSPAIPRLPRKRVGSSICTSAIGKVSPWGREYVLSADEKTSIQARRRRHPTLPPRPGRPMYVEHEYERAGAWAYLAAWDVHRAKIFGRCEPKKGIAPFDRLVEQVMTTRALSIGTTSLPDRRQWLLPPRSVGRRTAPDALAAATRSHAGTRELAKPDRNLLLDRATQGPYAERLPQPARRQEHLLRFKTHYKQIASPFRWTFTRRDLHRLMDKLATGQHLAA